MNYSDYRFTLDIQIHQAQVSIPVTFGDSARRLCIGLTDGRKPYTIGEGCRAVFNAKKPDGNVIKNDCIIERNVILYEFTEQTTNSEGIVNCDITLYNASGKVLTSPQFIIVVDKRVVRDAEVPVSQDQATAIDNMLTREAARITAESIRQQNEDERIAEENIRDANENNRVAAESARQITFNNNEAERVSAEGLRADAEAERNNTEKTRYLNEGARINAETQRAANEAERANAEIERTQAETERANAEAVRANAEKQREAEFASAEETRKNTFETNEAARQAEFNTAEAVRSTIKDCFQASTNLYDEDKVTVGKVLQYWNNQWKDNALYNTSDYIPVSVGDVLTVQANIGSSPTRQILNFGMVVTYDSNLNFLKDHGTAEVNSYTVPEGVAYVRVSVSANNNRVAVVRGTDIIPYEPYKIALKTEHHDAEYIKNLAREVSPTDEHINDLIDEKVGKVGEDIDKLTSDAEKTNADLSALNSFVKKETLYSWGFDVSVGTATGIKATVPHPVNIPKGKMCTVTITDSDNIIKAGVLVAVGENTANGWLGVAPNASRAKATETDVSNIALYLSSSNVVSDGVIRLEISYTDENPDSLESRVEALENGADDSGEIDEALHSHLSAENPHAITTETLGLGLASVTKSGLMSHTDKQKLDNLVGGGNITINGSGVTKNASAFGFLPTNDAETNSIALQNALNGGGTILVDLAGVYEVCKTIYLDSNTTLIFGSNVFLKKGVNANGVHARYTFINRGAFTGDTNENIKIIGLHLLTNGLGGGEDISPILGQRGHLAFYHIKHLRIEDFEITDGTDVGWYNIHIQDFDDIHLENITIISQKDGMHLGSGKNFVIKHCSFLTNDDAIALNAHDYPTGTSRLGWIENGIIEDIHLLADPTYRQGRGIYMLGGSWREWESGLSYRTYGDACVSNGKIYRTTGVVVDQPYDFIVSTVRPDFESGTQTLSDGVTWTMAQDYKVGYTAGVRNVVMRDIRIDRESSAVLTLNVGEDKFTRSYYPGSEPPIFKNIKLENVVLADNQVKAIAVIDCPVRNLKFVNCQYNTTASFLWFVKEEMASFKNDVLIDGTYFEFTEENSKSLIWARYGIPVDVKIVNSMGNIDHTKTVNGTGINIISNDIGL